MPKREPAPRLEVEVPDRPPVLTRHAAQVLLALLREAATEPRADDDEKEGDA